MPWAFNSEILMGLDPDLVFTDLVCLARCPKGYVNWFDFMMQFLLSLVLVRLRASVVFFPRLFDHVLL